jgi:hypothetical protein
MQRRPKTKVKAMKTQFRRNNRSDSQNGNSADRRTYWGMQRRPKTKGFGFLVFGFVACTATDQRHASIARLATDFSGVKREMIRSNVRSS